MMRHLRLLSVLAAVGCGGGMAAPPPPGTGFLRARGTEIIDGDGNPVFLKGVSLGNEVWANMAIPDDHAQIDFQRLADMSANSTRFLLNYVTFEDDAAPYVYKAAGWAWIDQNVAWAKAHGIHLILNMHVPQGGFQSNGDGGALWNDLANQDRLTALWKEIARRYADEPIIAGFGLVNEPEPVASRQQWQDLSARILTAIRSVDTNHIVFVERPIAVAGDFNSDANMNLFTIVDANVAYEFHFYEPTDYTFQLQPWNNTPDGGAYPDPTKIAGVTEQWINLATFDAPTAPVGTSDWTHYDGTRITAARRRPPPTGLGTSLAHLAGMSHRKSAPSVRQYPEVRDHRHDRDRRVITAGIGAAANAASLVVGLVWSHR
jgi:endoglucanase